MLGYIDDDGNVRFTFDPDQITPEQKKIVDKFDHVLNMHAFNVHETHDTETRCPKQAAAFADTLQAMYETHLAKNADYSPANVLGAGELGLMTRLWDKTARLMNLYGFKFDVSNPRHEPPKQPKNESIDD